MLRKFMMVGLLVFISPGQPAQLGCALLITLFFLFAHLILQPFATPDLNNMQAVSQGSLTLTLFVGLMMIIDAYIKKEADIAQAGEWGIDGTDPMQEMNHLIFSMIAVVVNMTTMIIPPLMMMKNMRKTFPSPRAIPGLIKAKFVSAKECGSEMLTSAKQMIGFGKKEELPEETGTALAAAGGFAVLGARKKERQKLMRPGTLPKPLTPAAIGSDLPDARNSNDRQLSADVARSPPVLLDDSDKSAARTPDVTVQEDVDRLGSFISANEFRQQMLQGTEPPKQTSEADLEKEHPLLFSPREQSRIRQLADAPEFNMKSDTLLLLQPPRRRDPGMRQGSSARSIESVQVSAPGPQSQILKRQPSAKMFGEGKFNSYKKQLETFYAQHSDNSSHGELPKFPARLTATVASVPGEGVLLFTSPSDTDSNESDFSEDDGPEIDAPPRTHASLVGATSWATNTSDAQRLPTMLSEDRAATGNSHTASPSPLARAESLQGSERGQWHGLLDSTEAVPSSETESAKIGDFGQQNSSRSAAGVWNRVHWANGHDSIEAGAVATRAAGRSPIQLRPLPRKERGGMRNTGNNTEGDF